MAELLLKPLSVLIVDDSAFNRRTLTGLLTGAPGVLVAGVAADGAEALRLAAALTPDVITLDLEMPKIDGFTFLRMLMSKRPTPVIVISSYSQKENVFKALELGAIDFVAKPDRYAEGNLEPWKKELLGKLNIARSLRTASLVESQRRVERPPLPSYSDQWAEPPPAVIPPKQIVVMAASTGGPGAITEILSKLPKDSQQAFVIAQHMPQMFTAAFAERLQRRSKLQVREAKDGDIVGQGMAFVCPGGQCMELERSSDGMIRLLVQSPRPGDRYVPSADRLLKSAAHVFGGRATALILTGMGEDGVEGARAILKARGLVIAEDESTAVVDGMPSAVARAGAVSERLPLPEIAARLLELED